MCMDSVICVSSVIHVYVDSVMCVICVNSVIHVYVDSVMCG